MGAAILDFFATSVFFDDLEVDAFLFDIVTIITLTDFDLPGWNTGRRLVALRCCSAWGWLRTAGCVLAAVCMAAAAARWTRDAGAALCCAQLLLRGCVARESWFALLRGMCCALLRGMCCALLGCIVDPLRADGASLLAVGLRDTKW